MPLLSFSYCLKALGKVLCKIKRSNAPLFSYSNMDFSKYIHINIL